MKANTQTVPASTAPGQTEAAGTTAGTQPQQYTQSGVVAIPGTIPIPQTTTPTETTTPADSSQPTQTTQPTSTTTPTETTAPPETTQPEASSQTVTVNGLTYRLASYDDLFVDPWMPLQKCVVITGVTSANSDGIYKFPSTITWTDGTTKQVLGVADYAFAGTNARIVTAYNDERSFGLGRYAFSGCPLESFSTNCGMYVHETAFSGCPQGFILRTEGTNSNQYDEFFSDCAWRYGAVWEMDDE